MAKSGKPDEFEMISRYFAPLAAADPGALGLADDAALLTPEPGRRLVITTDSLVAGVHFPVEEDPALVAAKLIGVNLSDLAAMGATPWAYTLSVAWPKDLDAGWVELFAAGLAREQETYGIHLVGGDTVATPGPLTLCLTALGSAEEGRELRRSGAQAGDDVYVSGTIGDAALGLKVLKGSLGGLPKTHSEALLARYRRPLARVRLGQGLAGLAHGCIDISDGLVADLGHVVRASGCDATIDADRVPFSDAARAAIAIEPALMETAITGGDDYELLFTAPPSAAVAIGELAAELDLPLTAIGRIAPREGEDGKVGVVDGKGRELSLKTGGYRHF